MKTTKIISLIAIIALSFSSCIVNQQPYYPPVSACFATAYDTYQVDEIIYFNNCSQNVVNYYWDFGDGTTSTVAYPSHSYNQKGNYQVTLTAYGQDSRSETSHTVTIDGSTDLDILVMFDGTSSLAQDFEVTLYQTELDWQNLTNPFLWGNTDNYGSIIFTNLDAVEYFIDAYFYVSETSYYSNEILGYITDPLVIDQVNYYNIYVTQMYITKGERNSRKSYVIKKIEKTDGKDIYRQNRNKLNIVSNKK